MTNIINNLSSISVFPDVFAVIGWWQFFVSINFRLFKLAFQTIGNISLAIRFMTYLLRNIGGQL